MVLFTGRRVILQSLCSSSQSGVLAVLCFASLVLRVAASAVRPAALGRLPVRRLLVGGLLRARLPGRLRGASPLRSSSEGGAALLLMSVHRAVSHAQYAPPRALPLPLAAGPGAGQAFGMVPSALLLFLLFALETLFLLTLPTALRVRAMRSVPVRHRPLALRPRMTESPEVQAVVVEDSPVEDPPVAGPRCADARGRRWRTRARSLPSPWQPDDEPKERRHLPPRHPSRKSCPFPAQRAGAKATASPSTTC